VPFASITARNATLGVVPTGLHALEGGRSCFHRRFPHAVDRAEYFTRDNAAWYAGTRAGSEARVAFEQAEELSRVRIIWERE
jgi:hypothetical protein